MCRNKQKWHKHGKNKGKEKKKQINRSKTPYCLREVKLNVVTADQHRTAEIYLLYKIKFPTHIHT